MDTRKSILTTIIKIIGLIAIVNTIFGVTFQKGMIIGMNFGNLSGNYDIREIFNSAAFGYLEIFNILSIQSIFELMSENWTISVLFLLFGLTIPFFYRQRHNWDENREKVKSRVKDTFDRVASSYIWSSLFGAILGIFVNFITAISYHLILLMLALLLLPAMLGYDLGMNKINSIMDNPPCVGPTDEMLNNMSHIRQCTHLRINGIEIKGDILLENNDAFFLHLMSSFLYYKKDGNVCISSKFKRSEDVENLEKFEFMKDQTDILCNTIKLRKTSA